MKTLNLFLVLGALFLMHGIVNSQTLPKGTLVVCENTDDKVFPINPKTTVKVGEPVVYQVDLEKPYYLKDEKEPVQCFIAWEVYKVGDDGKDNVNVTELSMTTSSTYKRYAIEEFQYFNTPGKYRVYALPWEMRDVNFKEGNYTKYFGKTEFEVVE